MRKVCTRCRRHRAMVRPYDVRAFDGDSHPVHAELCKPCVVAVMRGCAKVAPTMRAVANDARALSAYEKE